MAKNILNFVSLLPWETWCLEYLVIYNFEYSLKKLITKDDGSTEELKEPNPEDKSQKKPHNSMFSLTKSDRTIDMEGKVINIGTDAFSNPIFQKVLQN